MLLVYTTPHFMFFDDTGHAPLQGGGVFLYPSGFDRQFCADQSRFECM